ncbi:MAG: response regulator transcription factor [Planctomycetota bacterium]
MTKILVVEDDENLRFGISFNLKKEGWEVVAVESAEAGAEALREERPDLVLLDVMLPGMNGFEWLESIRHAGNDTPVVMLTARSDESDAVTALTLGADDYVRKPFGPSELIARLAAILRRSKPRQTPSGVEASLTLGPWSIDLKSHRAVSSDDRENLTMTNLEVEILSVLNAAGNEAVTREDLLERIWGLNSGAATRTLDNHVARLRRKLEVDPQNPELIVTIYGVGYRLNSRS